MTKRRSLSKVDQLPDDVKELIDEMLLDTSVRYIDISEKLCEMGHEISKSAVGRYAIRQNAVKDRLMAAQEQTKALVKLIQKNPEVDYTEASMQMLMSGLTEKLALAEEEFDDMPMDKAGRLIIALSRTKIYKDKVQQDMKDKAELAFEQLESEMLEKIKKDPQLAAEMRELLQRAKGRLIGDVRS